MSNVSIDMILTLAVAVVRAIKSYVAVNAVPKERVVVVRRAVRRAISVETAGSVKVSS
jgi:hypothetical protein